LQAHPWFDGVEWDKLYQMEAAFIPEVKDDLDTQNFENFEEVLTSLNFFYWFCEPSVLVAHFASIFSACFALQSENQTQTTSKTGPWRKVSLSLEGYFYYLALFNFDLQIRLLVPLFVKSLYCSLLLQTVKWLIP